MSPWVWVKLERLRSSYWFIPSLMSLISIALAYWIVGIDRTLRDEAVQKLSWIYSGGPAGARAVLSTIAGSVITVAGTTFSITIAALSLASSQFGPRLLRNFMRDTGNQVVLGTFTSTFLYCILVLRTVRGGEEDKYVPHIAVTTGVALAIANLGVLIYFIHHVAESIQVNHVIEVVSKELKAAVLRLFPESTGTPVEMQEPPLHDAQEVTANRDGYLQTVDEMALIRLSEKRLGVLKVLCRPGDYVICGMPLALVSFVIQEKHIEEVRSAFIMGPARTPQQDLVFAFHQLAEIAMRALSPGVNDPFTAITCIDRITSAMTQLGSRTLPPAIRLDSSGRPCFVAYPYSYDDLVEAGYRHIREAARGHWQVSRHLRSQLEFLTTQHLDPLFLSALRREIAALGRDPDSVRW